MLYTVRLGSDLISNHLATLLSRGTTRDSLEKTIAELKEGTAHLEELLKLGDALKIIMRPHRQHVITVNLDTVPSTLASLLEPCKEPCDGGLEEQLGMLDKLLALPNVSLEEATFSGDELVEASPPETIVAPISSGLMADMFGQLERHDVRVVFVLMTPANLVDIRKFGRDLLDIEKNHGLNRHGVQGYLWGASIISRLSFAAGTVQFLGVQNNKDPDQKKEVWFRQVMRVTR